MFRLQGQPAKFRAAEVNRWNALADQHARGELRDLELPTVANYDPSSRVAVVRNDTGQDLERFACVGLDGLVWGLDSSKGITEVVWRLALYDATTAPGVPPAILIEPIPKEQCGRAVIDGLALAQVAAGSGTTGVITSAATIAPGGGPIRLLSDPDANAMRVLPVLLDRNAGVLIKTPGGGIGAASGSGPYTFASASCSLVEPSSGAVSSNSMLIYNIVDDTIAASVVGKAALSGDRFIIDVASCA